MSVNVFKCMCILLCLFNWLGDGVMVSLFFYIFKYYYFNAYFILVGLIIICEFFKKDEKIEVVFIDNIKKFFFRLLVIYKFV